MLGCPVLQELVRLVLVLLHIPAVTDKKGHLRFLRLDIPHIQNPGFADVMLPGFAELLPHHRKRNGAEPHIALIHRSPVGYVVV
ncbi:hypothetical protein D3C71_1624350 [compost metagenome]